MCYLPREIAWIQRLPYRWVAFALKLFLERSRTGIRKLFCKDLIFFLLKEHGEPHMKSLHHKNIHFLRLKNISKHTADTSFTLVSLYFSRSDVLKHYTVLESFMIYKLNLTFQQCKSFHISGLSRLWLIPCFGADFFIYTFLKAMHLYRPWTGYAPALLSYYILSNLL